MIVGTCTLHLSAPWVSSLKEKRMVIKSIVQKVKNKFNVSIAEIEEQDTHQTIILGFACVSNAVSHANSTIDHVLNFIENNTEANVEKIEIEIL